MENSAQPEKTFEQYFIKYNNNRGSVFQKGNYLKVAGVLLYSLVLYNIAKLNLDYRQSFVHVFFIATYLISIISIVLCIGYLLIILVKPLNRCAINHQNFEYMLNIPFNIFLVLDILMMCLTILSPEHVDSFRNIVFFQISVALIVLTLLASILYFYSYFKKRILMGFTEDKMIKETTTIKLSYFSKWVIAGTVPPIIMLALLFPLFKKFLLFVIGMCLAIIFGREMVERSIASYLKHKNIKYWETVDLSSKKEERKKTN